MRWYDSPPDRVACGHCGLLSQWSQDAEVSDVPLAPRDEPTSFWDTGIPHCAVGWMALDGLYERLFRASGDQRGAAVEAIKTERQCYDWTPYMVGFSLQDHLRERAMWRLEQERIKLETVLREAATKEAKIVNTGFFRLGALQVFIGVVSVAIVLANCGDGGVTIINRW